MNRTKGILAAGTFTGLVLITILALGFGPLGRTEAKSNSEAITIPAVDTAVQTANGAADTQTLQAWQEYSAQLEQTVRALQQRDLAYQQQLETANQTILQLQDQINSEPAPSSFAEREEHEEHERGEHEAFEFGEDHDD